MTTNRIQPTQKHMALAHQLYAADTDMADPVYAQGPYEAVADFEAKEGRLPRCEAELEAWMESKEAWSTYIAATPVGTVLPTTEASVTDAAQIEAKAAADHIAKRDTYLRLSNTVTGVAKELRTMNGDTHVSTAVAANLGTALREAWSHYAQLCRQDETAGKIRQATKDKLIAKGGPAIPTQSIPTAKPVSPEMVAQKPASVPTPTAKSAFVPGAAIAKRDALYIRAKAVGVPCPVGCCNLAEFEDVVKEAEAKVGVKTQPTVQTPIAAPAPMAAPAAAQTMDEGKVAYQQLKKDCKAAGLSAKGKKAELVARLATRNMSKPIPETTPAMAAQTVQTTPVGEVTGDKAALLNRVMAKLAGMTMADITSIAQLIKA